MTERASGHPERPLAAEATAGAPPAGPADGEAGAPQRRSRRAHRILVTAIVLSPLVALVILVLVMLRTIEHRAAEVGEPSTETPAPVAPSE